MLQILLEDQGWDTEQAPSGEQALRLAGPRGRFDALVVDYRMPGLDGAGARATAPRERIRATDHPVLRLPESRGRAERRRTLGASTVSKSDQQQLAGDDPARGHGIDARAGGRVPGARGPRAEGSDRRDHRAGRHALGRRRRSLTDAQVDDCLDRISRQGRPPRPARRRPAASLSGRVPVRFEVSLEPVDLARAAERALESAPSPPDKSVELDVPEPVWALADQDRLEQVLVNLLTNAYRYGGSTVRVEARDDARTGRDHGRRRRRRRTRRAGAEAVPALLPRAGADGVNGSGLGLAISRALVEGSRGSHLVRARPSPAGARFSFTLRAAVVT